MRRGMPPVEVTRRTAAVLNELEPMLRRKVEAILADVNAKSAGDWWLGAFEGHRDPERQLELYRQGMSKVRKGLHNKRPAQACDLVFWVGGRWSWRENLPWHLIGRSAEAHGLEWGGNWKKLVDRPHVQLTLAQRAKVRLGIGK